MITKTTIALYKKYKANMDSFARMEARNDKLSVTDDDWYLLDSLIQDLTLVRKGIASDSFASDLKMKLKEHMESDSLILELEALIK